jgi:hypothetical protein
MLLVLLLVLPPLLLLLMLRVPWAQMPLLLGENGVIGHDQLLDDLVR